MPGLPEFEFVLGEKGVAGVIGNESLEPFVRLGLLRLG